ncbi:vWA domain-containing protein [Chryseobacterium sp. FH2]|uniref:vWA domain-containing protein n=1 Tax=Chryseobacterium sp. FH2 TaxID=1674291 RepID=UPI00065ABF81|nr:hypothetical protein [Chryseobacterium sp. FH2]
MIDGIKSFYEAVRKDDLASNTVEICVIAFGNGVKQIIQFASLKRQKEQFKRMLLKAEGESPIGEALDAGLEILDERKKKYKEIGVQYYQPWMVLKTSKSRLSGLLMPENGRRFPSKFL